MVYGAREEEGDFESEERQIDGRVSWTGDTHSDREEERREDKLIFQVFAQIR